MQSVDAERHMDGSCATPAMYMSVGQQNGTIAKAVIQTAIVNCRSNGICPAMIMTGATGSPQEGIMKSKKLLFSITKNDFEIDTFKSGGKGGQHQNTTNSGVRIRHIDSGAVGESREHRSQHQNKEAAFNRLVKSAKFKIWIKHKTSEMMLEKTIDEIVDESLFANNIKIEVRINGEWVAEKAQEEACDK